MVTAVALGVGLGVGLKKGRSNTLSPSNSTSPTFTRGAVNDTSLAAVLTSDGNRHIFLQDINGTLRHAVLSSVENLWLSDADYLFPPVPVSPPRLGTPITVTYPATPDPSYILVYYVNVNNTLSAILYDIDLVGVVDGDTFNGSIAIKPDSHCISAATIKRSANDEFLYTLLFFEAPSGGITFLFGQSSNFSDVRTPPNSGWEWKDMSEVLDTAPWRESGDVKASLGCPCTSSSLQYGDASSPANAQAVFFNPEFLVNASAPLATGLYFINATEAGMRIESVQTLRFTQTDPLQTV